MYRSVRIVISLALVVLVASLSGLVGCGAKESSPTNEVVVGFLADCTGPIAFGVSQDYEGLRDYFRMVEDEHLIPGVSIKLLTYDTMYNPARVGPGYIWLRGQGADLVNVMSTDDANIIRHRYEADQVPCFVNAISFGIFDSDWTYGENVPAAGPVEVFMLWLMDNWDYEGKGNPKIGYVGRAGAQSAVDQFGAVTAVNEQYPNKFDVVGAETPPAGTQSWAVEVGRLKDCDFIVLGLAGPPLPTFVKEARDRGYQGGFMSAMEFILAFWDMLRNACPAEYIDRVVVASSVPMEDTGAFMTECRQYTFKYLPQDEAEFQLRHSARRIAWARGMVIADAIKRAAEKGGDSDLNGLALRDALQETDMEVEGFGIPWNFDNGIKCFLQGVKIYEYRMEKDEWISLGDWVRPPCLGG